MYTYEPNLMPHEELDGFYTLNYFTDLAMERLFVARRRGFSLYLESGLGER